MKVEFSIIIPAYNRAGQLLLTLAAFENQTFPRDRYEIIVVDDGSTDTTPEMIRKYNAPYRLQLITADRRRGPAVARNLGVKQARGEYIIFCDADFLVLPDFLEAYHYYQSKDKRTAFSGVPYCYKRAYTYYFPEFTTWEKRQMRLVLEKSGLWNNRFAGSPVPIISPEDIRHNFSKIKQVVGGDLLPAGIKKAFLKTDVAPWLLFITRCVSVKKEYLQQAGGFDERLVRGSGEDWELGYRLHRLGVTFSSIPKVTGFHQEHPHAYRNLDDHFTSFSTVLQEKFGREDPELLLLSIWESSDELWQDLPNYKNTLRLFRQEDRLPAPARSMVALLVKACKRCARDGLGQVM